jgi:transposase-like protein
LLYAARASDRGHAFVCFSPSLARVEQMMPSVSNVVDRGNVVFRRLRYKLSLRDLTEMFLIRGVEFGQETVQVREAKLTPALIYHLRRPRVGRIGRSWDVDETYIKARGRWCCFGRSDRSGALVDVRLREKRDMAAAKAFHRSASAVTGVTLALVTTDGHDSYTHAIRTETGDGVKRSAFHRSPMHRARLKWMRPAERAFGGRDEIFMPAS